MIKYFTIEDLLKHYLQKKFHILLSSFVNSKNFDLISLLYRFLNSIQGDIRVFLDLRAFLSLLYTKYSRPQ